MRTAKPTRQPRKNNRLRNRFYLVPGPVPSRRTIAYNTEPIRRQKESSSRISPLAHLGILSRHAAFRNLNQRPNARGLLEIANKPPHGQTALRGNHAFDGPQAPVLCWALPPESDARAGSFPSVAKFGPSVVASASLIRAINETRTDWVCDDVKSSPSNARNAAGVDAELQNTAVSGRTPHRDRVFRPRREAMRRQLGPGFSPHSIGSSNPA